MLNALVYGGMGWADFATLLLITLLVLFVPFQYPRRKLGEALSRLDKLARLWIYAHGTSRTIKKQLASITKRLELIEGALSSLTKRMDLVEGALSSLTKRMDLVEGTLSLFTKRLDLVEGTLSPVTNSHSPLVLNDEGQDASREAGMLDIAKKYLDALDDDIDAKMTEYVIQQKCFDFCSDKLWSHLNDTEKAHIDKVAFKRGWNRRVMLQIAGIELRDIVFKKHNIDIETSQD